MSTPTPQAEELKALGNAMYAKGKFGAAIDAYTDAVLLCPRWLPVILNRALCYRKKKQWNKVKDDCLKALDIDRESIKGNYMLGLSLIAERNYLEAVRRLQKALENARSDGALIQDEIWRELARAKYLQWEIDAAARASKVDAVEAKLAEMGLLDSDGGNKGGVIDLVHGDGMDVYTFTSDEKQTLLEMVASERAPDDSKYDPPDCFCCVLTFEVFRDPVVTKSGNSYERSAVETHLQRVGNFDPITREPMTQADLIPNVGLRNAAHNWLNEHAWAYADIIKPDAPLGGDD